MKALVGAAALALAACAPLPVARTYTNPVLDRDFPDPAVLRAPDGWYYAYATQSEIDGRALNIQVARSRDLVQWEHRGDALPAKPAWATGKQHFWAPHVHYDADLRKYFMYYSAEPDHATGKCLAVATADAPLGAFADRGTPLLCGAGIEHIDPMAFDDPRTGKRLLYWGSGGEPIRVQELAADRLGFLPGSTAVPLIRPDERPYRTLIEAPWATYRDGWYYLFYSGDRCCTREPRYAVMVARSRDALGPFEDPGTPILEADDRWLAPGHNSVVTDENGREWMLHHAIDRPSLGMRNGLVRLMLLSPIVYEEGWPRVVPRRAAP